MKISKVISEMNNIRKKYYEVIDEATCKDREEESYDLIIEILQNTYKKLDELKRDYEQQDDEI